MADVLAILPLLLSAIRGAYLLTNTIKGMKNHQNSRRRIQRVVDCQTMRFTNQLYRVFRDSKCDGIILLTRVEDLFVFEQERNMLPEEESGVEIAIRGHFKERQDELHHIFKTFIEVANQANQTLENISRQRNLSMVRGSLPISSETDSHFLGGELSINHKLPSSRCYLFGKGLASKSLWMR